MVLLDVEVDEDILTPFEAPTELVLLEDLELYLFFSWSLLLCDLDDEECLWVLVELFPASVLLLSAAAAAGVEDDPDLDTGQYEFLCRIFCSSQL